MSREIDAKIHKALGREISPGWLDLVPHYSTDIAAAFEVVEVMRERGFRYVIDHASQGDAYVVFGHADTRSGKAWDASVPTGICLAALKALGVEP